jgi:hypothetical protein
MSHVLALMRRHVVATLAIVLALTGTAVAAGGGLAPFARKDAASRIYACVTPRFRTLNLTTAQAHCPHGAQKISWGAEGPRGLRGAAGPQGDMGSQGAKGDTGSPGAKGDAGPQGPKGETGTQGPGGTGPQGPAGPQGDPGPQGPAGDDGATGSDGPQGPQGPTGPEGPQGPQGGPGVQGDTGPRGQVGPQGPAGDVSFLGAGTASSVQRASGSDATVAGGADIPFSGPTSNGANISHDSFTTRFTVDTAGRYRITATVNVTAGTGSALAVAVNGTVRVATNVSILSTGQTVSDTLLALSAGDVLTVRNNSSVPFTTDLSPGVGASLVIQRIN